MPTSSIRRRLTWALAAAFLCALVGTDTSWAARTPRYGQASALMPDGRILVTGGTTIAGAATKSVEIIDVTKGGVSVPASITDVTDMTNYRSSHTITVLPNGTVLVTGGWDGSTSTARSDAEVYTPATGLWATVAGMQTGRFNHTATLLNTGKVLVCGGQTGAAATVTNTCDLFDPGSNSFSTADSMLLGRAIHTATHLNDDTVWVAGGWNPAVVTPYGNYIVTTERYDPVADKWHQSNPLGIARAYHTATLTGDNKVMVVGGFNGKPLTNPPGTNGPLDNTEIFDPIGGSISPGPPTQARVQAHTAVLGSEGHVTIFGGRGNVSTAPFTGSIVFDVGVSTIYGNNNTGAYGSRPITGGVLSALFDFYLTVPATGKVIDGDISFTNPKVDLGGAQATLTGIKVDLQGQTITCDIDGTCGYFNGTLSFSSLTGGSFFLNLPLNKSNLLTISPLVTGSLNFSPAISAGVDGTVTDGSFTSIIRLSVPDIIPAGALIDHVQLNLSATATASWTQESSYTVTLNGGIGDDQTCPCPVIQSGGIRYIESTFLFTGVTGTIMAFNGATSGWSLGPNTVMPLSGVTPRLSDFAARMNFETNALDLGNQGMTYDAAEITIRDMIFGDYEFYDPKTSQWTFQPVKGSVSRPSAPMYGHSAVLLPNDDDVRIGGKDCTAGCLGVDARNTTGLRLDQTLLTSPDSFAAAGSALAKRAYHTATLLTDGNILLAGGTDGDTVLKSAEVFSTASNIFVPTAVQMQMPRENHSATLLPNGRVLLAGGFTTTANSTGPTRTAEIYYPDTKMFIPTTMMVSSHSNHTAVTLPDGSVFVAGGFKGVGKVSDVAEIYYSTSGVWSQVASMPAGKERALHATVQLQDGRILLCGGTNDSGHLKTTIVYTPKTNAWAALADMPVALQGHTATLLSDGRVLVAGGDDGFGETNSSYVYDPRTDIWAATAGTLNSPRYGQTATLLPNGNVMVSGGVQILAPANPNANALRSVEFFHPNGDAWTEASLSAPRSFHTVTLAPDGYLYLMGGTNGSIGSNVTAYTDFDRSYFTMAPDNRAQNPGLRQSSIYFTEHSTTTPFMPGDNFAVDGDRFRGGTEANSGAAGSASSSFSYPRLSLQKIGGSNGSGSQSSPGFIVDMTTWVYATAANQSTLNTRLEVPLPPTNDSLPYGWYMAWVHANDIHTDRAPFVQVGPPRPSGIPITNLVGTPVTTNTVTWTWDALGGIDGYNVYSATTGVFITTVAAAAATYTQTGLAPNAAASIFVAPYSVSGDGDLTPSNTYYTFSTAPVSVSIASVTYDTLLLQWGTNGNTPGTIYEVSMSTDYPVPPFTMSASTPVPFAQGLTDNFISIGQLQPSTTYTFRVRAYNNAGIPSTFGVYASTLTRTSVSGVGGVATSPTSITWSWFPSVGALQYRIFNSSSGQQVGTVTPPTAQFIDIDLATNTMRSVQVAVYTAGGLGPLSDPTTVYTQAAIPLTNIPPITGITTASFTVGWRSDDTNPSGTQYVMTIATGGVVISSVVQSGFPHIQGVGGLKPSKLYDVEVYAKNGDGVLTTPLVIGSTYTLPMDPTNPTYLGATPVSISLGWDGNNNPTNISYQVTYSSDGFYTISTAIPFSMGYNVSTATISGLITSTTYQFEILAQNPFGQLSKSVRSSSMTTPNGGAVAGALAGVLTALGESEVMGNIVTGAPSPDPMRSVDIRSPSGAFSTDVTVTISSHDATPSLCANGVNIALNLNVTPALQPLKPLHLTVSYNPSELGSYAATRLAFMRYEPVSNTCVPLSTTFDTQNRTFTATLNHFSRYQLAAVPLATTADTARIFPNPYMASHDGYVTIDRVPPLARIRVMTLRGEKVFDQKADDRGILIWTPSNGTGRSLASGLYLIVVEYEGTKKILKLAVIR